ncbi:MAG: bifunctional phosphopantothenoylcysteine decarboxylase/phosphopantothenate--cysteine ligase CoaBC [Gammaproteobacteria bacterium]|nr:bifunctional phosphopantothenoylcysteine decarboxylase/phosphopantothenate--cysteine ligase CoaBC [Gammaproteobacteria bacterium]
MNTLTNKHIVIGITGGIAAYKSADLTRRLIEAGADVRIVMTHAATQFVTAMTFQALSGHPVFFDNSDSQSQAGDTAGMKHIELARWADAIIIAPASANTIAKLAHGRADNLLTTLCLASEAIKCFAPAMNRVMWDDLSTQANCRTLVNKNWRQLGPATGLQACGETGEGRMLEVSDILSALEQCFKSGVLQGLNLVITAGPTYEAIDPVRYIGNRSSGRMGYAIAEAARDAGANVTLISGPSHLAVPQALSFVAVESAEEMKRAVLSSLDHCHIFISTAAVSDYRVAHIATQKIKKTQDNLSLQLTKNDDIIAIVASQKTRPYVVGFAAETENVIENAKQKLQRKNLDMIVANDVSKPDTNAANTDSAVIKPDIGFNSEYNALHVFWTRHIQNTPIKNSSSPGEPYGEQHFEVARKSQLAVQLISLIAEQYTDNKTQHEQNTA